MVLVLAILSSAVCLFAAVFLCSKKIRRAFRSEGIALFFAFEGLWIMINHIISGIWPSNNVMDIIHAVGCFILGIYVVFSLYTSSKKITKRLHAKSSSDI